MCVRVCVVVGDGVVGEGGWRNEEKRKKFVLGSWVVGLGGRVLWWWRRCGGAWEVRGLVW